MNGKLTSDNYFEDTYYMSVSAFKKLNYCEVAGLEPWGEPSTAMLIGSYVDAYVEGTLDRFKENHPELISSRGATKGQLKADYKLADTICEYIDSDKVFSQFMSGEKQVVMTGEIAGVPFKIMIDSYSKGIAINDLKVMRTVTDRSGKYIDFIGDWGYDIQMACYQEIVRQNTGERLPTYICAVTKESPINSVIVNIPQEYLDVALYEVESKLPHLYDVKRGLVVPVGCGVCKSCIAQRPVTPIISYKELVG